MKLTKDEENKFYLYCKYMEGMEKLAYKAKEKLLKQQNLAEPLIEQMTKRDKLLAFSYYIIAKELKELKKWRPAKTITSKSMGNIADLKEERT